MSEKKSVPLPADWPMPGFGFGETVYLLSDREFHLLPSPCQVAGMYKTSNNEWIYELSSPQWTGYVLALEPGLTREPWEYQPDAGDFDPFLDTEERSNP